MEHVFCFEREGKHLTLSLPGKIFRFDISCKSSPVETICMKCQMLYSGKNEKKYVIGLSSAELALRVASTDVSSLLMDSLLTNLCRMP